MKFEDIIIGSKEVIDIISEKAGEAVDASKAYINKTQIRLKIREKYAELGKLCYDMHKNDTDQTGNMKAVIRAISDLEDELKYAAESAEKPKICANCGTKNTADNSFCSKCGNKL